VGHSREVLRWLPFVMNQVPPQPGEESLYAMIQSVLHAASKDPKIKETLTQTTVAAEKELITPLFGFHNNGRPVRMDGTHRQTARTAGVDYLSRATAKSNMYDNAPQETRYIYTDFDSFGQRLNGAVPSPKVKPLHSAHDGGNSGGNYGANFALIAKYK